MQETLFSLVRDDKHPTRDEIGAVSEALQESESRGLWIFGAKSLALDEDSEATICGWDYYDLATHGLRYVRTSGSVVLTRVESRETFAAPIAQLKTPMPSEGLDSEEDEPEMLEGDNLITFRFGLRDRLPELPWRSGTYLVDVAMDGEMSNRLKIAITPGKAAERDPAIAAYIEEQKGRSAGPLDFFPPLAEPATPEFRPSLEIPWVDGISLKVNRVSVYTREARNVLQGSFRLKLPAGFYRNAEAGGPTGTVPITLVITGNDRVGPFVAPLRVPTYDPIEEDTAVTEVTGRFAVDLFALKQTAKLVQTYTIWAYSGAVRSEPVLNAIITPDMLQ